MIAEQHFMPWKIGISFIHSIAIATTFLRLEHRRRAQKMWWDDWATIIPLLCEVPNFIVLWLRFRNGVSTHDKILLSYVNQFLYPTLSWWSRISIALAILRVTPPWSPMRRAAIAVPFVFLVFWAGILTAAITTCTLHTEWQSPTSSKILVCGPAYKVAIPITINVIADIALIVIPLHQLWNVSRRPQERRLVRLVFSSSSITAVSSLFVCTASYSKYFTGPGGLMVWLMVCYIATAVAIITSNLLVLACWLRHRIKTDDQLLEASNIHITLAAQWTSNRSWHCAERSTWKDRTANDNAATLHPVTDLEITVTERSQIHSSSDGVLGDSGESLHPIKQDSDSKIGEPNYYSTDLTDACIN